MLVAGVADEQLDVAAGAVGQRLPRGGRQHARRRRRARTGSGGGRPAPSGRAHWSIFAVTASPPAGSRRGSTPDRSATVGRSPARRRRRRRCRRPARARRTCPARSARWPGGRARPPAAWPAARRPIPPPADSPKTVTRSGSPPNAAMLSRTHSSAATWSSRPRLAGAPSIWREALDADPVVEGHHDDAAVAGQPAAVVLGQARTCRSRRRRRGSTPSPAGRRRVRIGRPDVDRQPVVAVAVRRPRVHAEVPACGGGGPNATRLAHPVPGATGRGAANRSAPTGGSANGMPRKTATPSSSTPRTTRPRSGPPAGRGRRRVAPDTERPLDAACAAVTGDLRRPPAARAAPATYPRLCAGCSMLHLTGPSGVS